MYKTLKKIKNKIFRLLYSDLKYYKKMGLKYGENVHLINCNIDQGHCWLIEIGNDVTITNSTLLAHDASLKLYLDKSKIGKIKIGDRVFIGFNSVILCNVTIGNDVIIGAGSVVTKDIPDNCIVVGNPAKIISRTDIFIEKHKKFMNTHPVFDTYWMYKSNDDITTIKEQLENQFGYDD